jgi:hypothetical protein
VERCEQTIRLVGVSFGNCQEVIARLQAGDPVQLVREPDHEYDENAIRVLDSAGELVGYVPRQLAAVLAPLMDEHGGSWPGEVAAIKGRVVTGGYLGIEIGVNEL